MAEDPGKLSKEDEESLKRLEDWWRRKPEKKEEPSKRLRDAMASGEPPVPKEVPR